METEPQVLIAGAGPTGLTLACGLLAKGMTAHVVDKAKEPAGTSRALGLQPRGIEVVQRLGALDGLPERALELGRIAVHINGKRLASVRIGQRTPLVTRPGLVISQAEVEAALRRRVTELGGRITWGSEVTAAEQDPHGVSVTFADGSRDRTGWLVGCDGAHSRVRELAGVSFPGVPLAERFLLVDAHADLPLPRDSIYAWLDGSSVLGVFPLPGKNLWRIMAPVPDPVADAGHTTKEEVLRETGRVFEERTGYQASLLRAPEWITSFRIHRRLANTYRYGRILLAGDAAHIHSPFGGQGMNTGIGDAENLAWKLAMVIEGTAERALLDTYEAERRPIAENVLRSTGAISNLLLGNRAVARIIRDRFIIPLMNRKWMQKVIWENVSQLKVSYRNGPLGRRPRLFAAQRGVLPGDRVPDLDCRSRDGDRTSLHAELGVNWALVVPGLPESRRYSAVVAEKIGGNAVTTLISGGGHRAGIMLVRPDAHLAWRVDSDTDPQVIRRLLTAMFAHGTNR